jgi:hypothetical protein
VDGYNDDRTVSGLGIALILQKKLAFSPAPATPRSVEYHAMQRLLSDLQGHPRSWPFLKPVNANDVVDYREVIKKPMGMLQSSWHS